MQEVCCYAFVQGFALGVLLGFTVRCLGGAYAYILYIMGGGE